MRTDLWVIYGDFTWVCLGVFDVLAYTDADVAAPLTWIESDPKLIANPQMVKLHSFDTKVDDDDAAKESTFMLSIDFRWDFTMWIFSCWCRFTRWIH